MAIISGIFYLFYYFFIIHKLRIRLKLKYIYIYIYRGDWGGLTHFLQNYFLFLIKLGLKFPVLFHSLYKQLSK